MLIMVEMTIPTIANASYSIEVVLDNNNCRLSFHWNETESAWYMNLEQLTEGYTLNGIKLMPGSDLLSSYATPELGALFVIDSEDKNRNPDFDSFGDIYVLMYISRAELG